MSAYEIDVFEFCHSRRTLEGEVAVAELPRLVAESIDGAGALRWTLQGGVHMRGHPQLALAVSGSIRLQCQRCLKSLELEIVSDSLLAVAQDEASADEMDDLLADEPIEVVVGSKAFDISVLIEDEALLAIPSSPRHDVCPEQVVIGDEPGEEKESPFAVLKQLKKQ